MATTLPANLTKVNFDSSGDDPAQAQAEFAANVDKLNDLLAALGAFAQWDLHTTPGLESTAQGAGTPDRVRAKVQSGEGLIIEAGGLRINVGGLTAVSTLQVADSLALQDDSAGGTKQRRITLANFLAAIAGSGITVNGSELEAAAGGGVDYQVFTSDDTWTKPAEGTVAFLEAVGPGGSGARRSGNHNAGGGGGGSYTYRWVPLSALGATESITIGLGGVAKTTDGDGNDGQGNTSIGAHLTAYPGGGGESNSTGTKADGGGGGGLHSAGLGQAGSGAAGDPGSPVAGSGDVDVNHTDGLISGGGGAVSGGNQGRDGGNAQSGGGGGGGAGSTEGAGGKSHHGGDGGDGNNGGAGQDGSAPGGGGGGMRGTSNDSGAGARGEARITVF